MIAGGAESCIHPLAFGGFARSRSLTTAFNDEPQKSSRPFDRNRDGFVIGEGAACLVLEVSTSYAFPMLAQLIALPGAGARKETWSQDLC